MLKNNKQSRKRGITDENSRTMTIFEIGILASLLLYVKCILTMNDEIKGHTLEN